MHLPFLCSVTSVCFSADGENIAIGLERQVQVPVVNAATGTESARVALGDQKGVDPTGDGVNSVVFSKDGSLLACAGTKGRVGVWETRDWKLVHGMHHEEDVLTVCISDDNRLVATGSCDKTARVWSLADPGAGAAGAAVSSGGGHGTRGWGAFFMDMFTGSAATAPSSCAEHAVIQHEDIVTCVAFSSSTGDIATTTARLLLVTASRDGSIRVATLTSDGKLVSSSPSVLTIENAHDAYVTQVCFLPSGLIASSSYDQTIRLHNTSTGALISSASPGTGRLNSVAAATTSGDENGDDVLVACSGDGKVITLFSLSAKSGTLTQTKTVSVDEGECNSLRSLSFSPTNPTHLAACSFMDHAAWVVNV